MNYISKYKSPLGDMILISDGINIIGASFEELIDDLNKYEMKNLPIFNLVKEWLDDYFNGKKPQLNFTIKPTGTVFQKTVWNELLKIAYGETISYGELAKIVGNKLGVLKMSAQAIGCALRRNPIIIIIPCHRVVGVYNKLTGYVAGLERKKYLLDLENNKIKKEGMN